MWLAFVEQRGVRPERLTYNSRLCSAHFRDDDFNSTATRRRLYTAAVPTVDAGFPVRVCKEPCPPWNVLNEKLRCTVVDESSRNNMIPRYMITMRALLVSLNQ